MNTKQRPPYHAPVVNLWTVRYPDPVELAAGDQVTLGKQDSEYPGWIWGTSMPSGKSGWIPETYLAIDDDIGVARRGYTAREIAVEEGEIVLVLEELLGWCWVLRADGHQGWMPGGHLARSTAAIDLPL
jgi:hypothetical protein